MIQQVAAAVPNPALSDTILPGAPNRSANRNEAQTLYGFQNLTMESVLAIKDQIPWRRIVREGLAELLSHPTRRWMSCDVTVEDAPVARKNTDLPLNQQMG